VGFISQEYFTSAPFTPLSRDIHLPLLLLLILLNKGDVAPVFGLEELGVLVGVKELTLLGPVELLLQHPEVAVGDGLLQYLVLLGVVAKVGLPQLLH
jgi:hypothetical protein